MNNFRTDLADERTKLIKSNLDGIKTKEKVINENLKVYQVDVLNKEGSKKIEKDIGTYITININDINLIDEQGLKLAKETFAKELKKIVKTDGPILVVGLGNEDTTADSIGPKVTKNLKITRHILKYNKELLPNNTRELSTIAPGVLGTTGIETEEIVESIISKIDISCLIVIDALETNDISRLLKTIQITDTGIVPGSGVNNKRKEISKKTLNIPVIAIGVPTVVEVATIVANTFDILTKKFDEFKFLEDSSFSEKHELIEKVLEPTKYNLAVMPKEIDDLVDNMKEIISYGINELVKI